MARLTVAAAQIACRPGDIAANLAAHLDRIAEARERGVDLLVFPELSLTDYLSAPDTSLLNMRRDDARLASLISAAGPMAVSVGFIERSAEGHCHIAQALLGSGRILAVHRKINLPGYGTLREPDVYTPGQELASVELPGSWRAATLICADAWNPALPWLAALANSELLILPAASSRGAVGDDFDSSHGWEVTLAHTAMIYGMPLVFTNHCGSRGGFDFWGGSRILDADGRELVRAQAGEELILASIDREAIVAARRRLPTVRDSTPRLIHHLLGERLVSPDE